MDDNVVVKGAWGVVEWARDGRGRLPAKAFFDELGDSDRAKMLVLFGRLAGEGKIVSREKFKKVDDVRGVALYEFKCHQLRFIGAYAPGARFVVAHAVRKKADELRKQDLEIAARVVRECL